MAQTNFTALLWDAAQKWIKETKKTTNNFQSLMSDSEDKKEKTSINDIAASLEWTDKSRFLSKWWFKNAWKVTWHWLDNAWHTITDKDTKNGIYDYSQFKEYNKQLKAAEASWETVDRDLFYQSMAKDGIIDYDKFKENYKEYEWQYDKYKKALENNKEDFSNKLKDSLSTAMSNAEGSYEINTLTKAIDKMVNQRQMFVDSVMTTYKDTRDKSLVDYMNETIDDYDNAIITFTKEWADHLTRENMKWGGAYYATIKDDDMKDLANTIVRIQNKAQNKMTYAAVADNFADSWKSFTHWNFISAAWEFIWAAMNGINWILDKAGNILEEWKQIAWWMYDVVEELNHLNTYADDASWFRKAFWTLGSWWMSIIDAIPQLWPAVADLFVWEKIGTLSKAAKAIKNADKVVDAAKQASLIDKIITKWKYKDFIKIWTEKWIQYLDEVTKDILVYDVAFQQFEWHPLTTDEMTLNLLFNLPLDWLSVSFNQWAKYFKPNIAQDILKWDRAKFISRELLNQLEKWIEKWYSDEKLAEIYYIWKWLETIKEPKHMISIEEGLTSSKKDLYERILKIQDDSTWIWERLTTFQWNMDDMVTEMTSRVSNRQLKTISLREWLVQLENDLISRTNLLRIFKENIVAHTNVWYIWRLIEKLNPDNPAEIQAFSEKLKRATEAATWKDSPLGKAIYWLFAWHDGETIAWLSKQLEYEEVNVAQALKDTVKELIRQDRKLLTNDPNAVVNGWYRNWDKWYNIYDDTKEPYQMLSAKYSEKERTEDLIKNLFWDDLKIQSIEADKIELWLDDVKLMWADENWMYNVTKVFQSEYLNPARFGNIVNDTEWKEITWLFSELWLEVKYDWNQLTIMWNEEAIDKITNSLSKIRQWVSSIVWLDSNVTAIAKILYLDEYINIFKSRNKILKNAWLTDTQIKNTKMEIPIDKIESKASKKVRWKINKNRKLKDKISTSIEQNEAISEEWSEKIWKELQKCYNWEQSLTDTNVNIWKHITDDIVNNNTIVWPDWKIIIDDWQLEDDVKEFLDWLIWISDEEADNILKDTDEIIDDSQRKLTGNIGTIRKVKIQNLKESRNLLAKTLVWYMRTFWDDNYKILSEIATRVLNIIIASPSALDTLAKNPDINFFKTIFARILIWDKEEGWKAALAYLTQWENMYTYASSLLKTADEKLLYNNWFKELWYCIEKWITAAKNVKMDAAVRNDLYRAFNKIWDLYDSIDLFYWQEKLIWFNPKKNVWKQFNVAKLDDKQIDRLADYLAKAQMHFTWVASEKLYNKLYKWFSDWLTYVKNNIPAHSNPTITITKWEYWYLIDSKDVELWVLQINLLLWNFDNAELLAKVAIWHEMWHQKAFTHIWEEVSRKKKLIDRLLKDKTIWWWEQMHRLARLKIQDEELWRLWWWVSDYILWLKGMLREALSKMKPWRLNQLYNSTQTILNKEEYYDLIDSLDKNNILVRLVRIANKIFKEENYGYLQRNEMINELLKMPEFSKIDEIITEAYSMAIMVGEWYKWINAYELNLVLDKAYEAAQLIDKFRSIFYDNSVKDARDVINILRTETNVHDLDKVPTWAEVIENKIFSNVWYIWWEAPNLIYNTPNEFVNELLSRWTNKKYTLSDIKNHKIQLPKWKKLVFLDLETTRLKEETVNWVYKDPDVLQMAIKEYENIDWELVEHEVTSNFYPFTAEWRKEYKKTIEQMQKDWVEKGNRLDTFKWDLTELVDRLWKKEYLQEDLEYLKKLNEDENVIFVFHNWLQFDLPIIKNLWVDIPEDKCIDTLQLYKALDPFAWTWKQEEMHKNIKWLTEAMKKFVKEGGWDLNSHNAIYDTQELYHIFWYLYENLRLNNKIKPDATPEEILEWMKKITSKMQHTPRWQYITKSMKWMWENYTIEWWRNRAIGLASMLSDAIKLSSDINEWKTTKQLADSIKKWIRMYIDWLDGTELRWVVDKMQLEEMLEIIKTMDDEEVVALWQMLDSVKPYIPSKKELKVDKEKVWKDEIWEFYDNIDIRSVEWELPEISDKYLFDKKSLIDRSYSIKQDNKNIADKLLSMDRYGTVNVAKTLSTMKGKLWEVWDAYLDRLIRIANSYNLEIDARKLLVWDETISRFKLAKKNWYQWDFNMFVINRLYYNVLSLKPELLKEFDIVNDTDTFDILDAIITRLQRWKRDWENVITNDTKVLEWVINWINKNITEKVLEWWEQIELPVKEILNSFTWPEIERFNNTLVRYIKAYKNWNVEELWRLEYIIMNSIISKTWSEYFWLWVNNMFANIADLSWKKWIRDYNNIRKRWKKWDTDKLWQDNYTLRWMAEILSDKIWYTAWYTNPNQVLRQMIKDTPDDITYWWERFDTLLRRINKSDKWEEFKNIEIDEFLQDWWEYVLSQIYKMNDIPAEARAMAKKAIDRKDIYKWLRQDYSDLEKFDKLAEQQVAEHEVWSKVLDTGHRDKEEWKRKEWEATKHSIITREPKRKTNWKIIYKKDWTIDYEYNLSYDFRSQLLFWLDDVLNSFYDIYKLDENIPCNTVDSISNTSKWLTINQWVFFNKALPNKEELETLFGGGLRLDNIAINRFSLFNKWIYWKGLVDNINNFWVNSIWKDSKLNVVFSDGTEIVFKAWEEWKKPIVTTKASDLELLLSAIKSITTKRGTSAMLINWQNKAITDYIYWPIFWNSFVWKYISQKFGFYDRIALQYDRLFKWKQIDEIYDEIQKRWLDDTIEWKPVLQAIYDLIIAPWKETYQYPNLNKLKEVTADNDEYQKKLAEIRDEYNKNYSLIKELEDIITTNLKWTDYDIVKEYKSDLQKLNELSIVLNPSQDANLVNIIDVDTNEVLKTMNNTTDTFEVILTDDYKKEIPFARIWYNYSEFDRSIGKRRSIYNQWNKGNRNIYVRYDKDKEGYRMVGEKEMEWDWSVYMIRPRFEKVKSEWEYWRDAPRYFEYKYWEKEEESKKKADELWRSKKEFVDDWWREWEAIEWNWCYIWDLLDEEWWLQDVEWWVFDSKKYIQGLSDIWEVKLIHDWVYDVMFRNSEWELMEWKVLRTTEYWTNWEKYPAYKVEIRTEKPYTPFSKNAIETFEKEKDISAAKALEYKKEMEKFHFKADPSVWDRTFNWEDIKYIPKEWLKKEKISLKDIRSETNKADIVEKYYLSLEWKYREAKWNKYIFSRETKYEELLRRKTAWEELTKEEESMFKSDINFWLIPDINKLTKEQIEDVFKPDIVIWLKYDAKNWWRNQNIITKELETDEIWWATKWKSEVEEWVWEDDEFANKWEWKIKLNEDTEIYNKILIQEQEWRYSSLSEKWYKQNFIDHEEEYKRRMVWEEHRNNEIEELDKQIDQANSMWKNDSAKALMKKKQEHAIVNKILNEWSSELPTNESKQLWWLWWKISTITNKSLIREDETIRQIVWERDTFMQLNQDKLYDIADRWSKLMERCDDDQKQNIFDAIRNRVNAARNKWNEHILIMDISNIDEEADEILNEFAKIMNFNWNWKNTEILSLVNSPNAINNIISKLNVWYSIVGMWKMWWTRQQTFEYAVKSAYLNWITDPKVLKNIWRDFVWDPLWVGTWQNALANLRSVNRFLKYSIPSPIWWTVMLFNWTLLWEQMYQAKKKWLSWFMDNDTFEKICLNENVLKIFSRWEDIVLHGNTDMDINMIAFDKALKWFADAFTKEWTKARQVAETIMLWWIHSLQDLTYSGKVRVLAFAQALQQKWITELQLDDILKKIESWEMRSKPEYLQAWNDIMARTEYFYDDFFTNSATAFMSRNKYSRLFIFNNLQWYVIKRTDEIWRAITGFKNWLAAKPQGVSYTWWDFVDHLEQNQELKAFLNNVILSTKLAYYFNRTDKIDWGEGDNIWRYMIEANDYLSSVPATFFYQLLTAPIAWYNKYSEWTDVTWEDKNLADGTSVVLMNVLSQVCSQFFRESKPLNALIDWAVSYAKTWDLWFAATVMGTDLEKIANWLWRFGLIDWLEKYWLEDFSADHDIIWQILLAWDKTSEVGKSIQDSYDISFVDNVLNDSEYAFISTLGNLPLIWEFIKSVSDKGWYTFNEAKVKELSNMMDNDKNLQNIMYWKFDYSVFKDHPDAINRIYNDFVSFNYTNEALKSPGKHAVWYFVDGKDTTLDSMKEDVFVKNICDKLWLTIEQFHYNITQWYRDDYNVKDRSAKTVWILKMLAAADAAEPGSWKIILSYMAANRLYELEKEYSWLDYPKTADLPEDLLTQLKAQVISEFASEMYTADRTNQYKVMREYISIANPEIFKSLYSDNTLKGYANSIGFLDMLTYQAAKDWDVNAKYFKNVFSLTSKYMKDDVNRLALMRHVMSTIDETDLDTSAKMIAKEWVLAGNIDVYNRCKENPYFRAMHPGVMEDFEHRIWWIWDYLNIAWSDYSWNWYKKWYTNYSKYNDGNQQVHDDLVKQLTPYTNPFSPQYIPRQWTRYINTPKWVATSKWYFNWQLKYYEGLIKTYSDRLVKSTGKKYPAEGTEKITFKTWSNNRGAIRWKQLNFPKHKSKDYRTKLFSNLPGSHW